MIQKKIVVIVITFTISIFIHGLIEKDVFNILSWNFDTVVDFLHSWLVFLTSYLLYNFLLSKAVQKVVLRSNLQWVMLLSGISAIVFLYVLMLDISYYKLYYHANSLSGSTTFFEYDLPIMAIMLLVGSLFFYQKYYNGLISKKANEALAFTQQLKAQKLATPDKPQELPNREEEKIWLDAENGKPAIQLAYTDIAFLKSDGNYVEIYYSDALSKIVVRNRLKYYAEKLPASDFFHCHKSYIINTHWVSEVRGNARNLELNISNSELWIPVSRSKADAFYGFLKGKEN